MGEDVGGNAWDPTGVLGRAWHRTRAVDRGVSTRKVGVFSPLAVQGQDTVVGTRVCNITVPSCLRHRCRDSCV
jgi:hypothetical protein